ncbi:hypothetical protein GPALN_003323 [Globodera pallida]|nr:hypothetical protein GPALN_003323 [Globodera pallida]
MDEFLTSKCITNESDFMEMSGDEKSNWEKELKQFILKLKCSELRTLFSQIDIKKDPMEIDDQQQPSTMSAKTFMEMLLNKMLEKLPKKVPKTKQHRLNVEQNVFADFERSSTSWFTLYEYFYLIISWHEPDENIAAWKMDEESGDVSIKQGCSNTMSYEQLRFNCEQQEGGHFAVPVGRY